MSKTPFIIPIVYQAFLAFNDPILATNVQRIEKNAHGRIETDAMLPQVVAALQVAAQSQLNVTHFSASDQFSGAVRSAAQPISCRARRF